MQHSIFYYIVGIIIGLPILIGLLAFLGTIIITPFLVIYKVWLSIFKFFFKIPNSIYKHFFSSQQMIPSKYDKQEAYQEEEMIIQNQYIQTSEYVGILTKIDKKKIAEEYLREEKIKKYAERTR